MSKYGAAYGGQKYIRQIRIHSIFKNIFNEIKFDFLPHKHPFVSAVDDLHENYFTYTQRSSRDNIERVAFLKQELAFLLMNLPLRNSETLWKLKVAQGMSFWDMGEYEKSFACFVNAKNYYRENEIISEHYAGIAERSLGRIISAITRQEKLLLHPKLNFESWKDIIAIHKELLILYSVLFDNNKVNEHFEKIKKIQSNYKIDISDYYMATARKIYFDAIRSGNYTKAITEAQELLKTHRQTCNQADTDYHLLLLLFSHLYLHINQIEKYTEYADMAFAICQRAHPAEHTLYIWAEYFCLTGHYFSKIEKSRIQLSNKIG